jgi:hypothetical protein
MQGRVTQQQRATAMSNFTGMAKCNVHEFMMLLRQEIYRRCDQMVPAIRRPHEGNGCRRRSQRSGVPKGARAGSG